MIYLKINKCGSTTVAKYIKGHCKTLYLLDHRVSDLGGWIDRETAKEETCFTVTRNPYTRAISQWQHCKRLGNNYTLTEWLRKDFNQMGVTERAHSLRQVDFLFDCKGHLDWVDYVFKLEDERLFEKLKELAQIRTNETPTVLAQGNYALYELNSKEKELIKMKYHLDFEKFGYEK